MRWICLVFLSGCMGSVGDSAPTPDAHAMADGGPSDARVMPTPDAMVDAQPDGSPPPRPDGGVEVARVTWSVGTSRVYSGQSVSVTLTAFDASGAIARADISQLEIAPDAGGGIADLRAVGPGEFAFDYRPRDASDGARLRAMFDGRAVGDASPAIEVVVPLEHYTASTAGETLNSVGGNLSGHAWNPQSGQFVLIRNNDRMMHLLDASFAHLAAVSLHSIPISSDLEDIVYLGGTASAPEYAVVDEAGNAAIGVIPATVSGGLDMGSWQRVTVASRPPVGNKGGEGIAFDPATNRMWVCTERSPMTIYEFVRPAPGADASYLDGLVVTQPFDAQASLSGVVTDVSSCLFDSRTGRLLLLSDESSRLVDVDWDGAVVATRDVSGAPQFEGVAIYGDHELLLTSEPNRYRAYRYDGPRL